jgi:opacity protein-like surface antigen
MKKGIFIVIFIISIFQFNCFGQLRIHAGSGINISNINFSGDDTSDLMFPKTKAGTHYFLSVRPEIGITENLSLSLDFQYSLRGYQVSDGSGFASRFHFIDVLPQVQYKFFDFVGLYAGCGWSYLSDEYSKFGGIWTKFTNNISQPNSFIYLAGIRFFPHDRITIHAHLASNRLNQTEYTDAQGNPLDIISKLQNLQIGLSYRAF